MAYHEIILAHSVPCRGVKHKVRPSLEACSLQNGLRVRNAREPHLEILYKIQQPSSLMLCHVPELSRQAKLQQIGICNRTSNVAAEIADEFAACRQSVCATFDLFDVSGVLTVTSTGVCMTSGVKELINLHAC